MISYLEGKAKIRRTIEAEEIPYTYVCSNAFAGYWVSTLGQENVTAPPRDKVVILGDGNVEGEPNYPLQFFVQVKDNRYAIELFDCFRCFCD